MTNSFSTVNIQQVLAFPFRGERWKAKFITGLAFMLAGCIIPMLPMLVLYGYNYRIMRQVIVEKGELELPEWDGWPDFIQDGWRLFSVHFIYYLPSVLLYVLGMVLYFASFIGMAAVGEENVSGIMPVLMFGSMGILFMSMALSMLLFVALLIVLPVASGHTVAKGSFSAGFDFSGWWKVLKANPGGFLISILLICGMGTLVMIVTQALYMSVVLCCLNIVVFVVGGYYILLVGGAFTALVYREGVEKLERVE
jgi:hypothetical protein